MRSFDLSPLFRYSVGFDRLDDLFETAFRNTQEVTYPPYNIVRTGQDDVPDHARGGRLRRE